MGFEAWFTLCVSLVIVGSLLLNLGPPDFIFLFGAALLALVGVITPKEAFAGFANEGMLTVGLMFVVAAALQETGVLDYFGERVLGRTKSPHAAMTRLSAVIVPISAFLNNTPVVAMFMPIVMDWCRRNQVSPSKLLIPVSYLAVLGGTCTLIGTSTNLVVHGLMLQSSDPRISDGMSLFEIGKVGVPYAILGVIYLLTIGYKLLPERKELLEQLGESRREYMADMLVQPGCKLIGRSVEAGGLRSLPGLFLIEIDRGGEIITPVGPTEILAANDRLVFTGVVSSVVELQKITGLVPIADPDYESSPASQAQRRMCEAVVSTTSPLIGETIRDADFRATYGAAVVAVHRGGSRVKQKVGDIRLEPGDTLLLQTQPHFARAHRNNPAFYLVSDVEQYRPARQHRAWISLFLFAVLLVLMTTDLIPIAVATALIAGALIATGCISAGDARRSVDWQVLVTIAASFGVGVALDKSGAAAAVAGLLFDATKSMGPLAALATLYFLGSVVMEVLTNNAAAVLMFPICLETAKVFDANPRPFVIALALAASASFMTPIGYQTNMMVYGPGGYKFSDFFRVGALLNVVLGIVAIILIPIFWPFDTHKTTPMQPTAHQDWQLTPPKTVAAPNPCDSLFQAVPTSPSQPLESPSRQPPDSAASLAPPQRLLAWRRVEHSHARPGTSEPAPLLPLALQIA
jgi:di/tricarboxylate transporter